MCKLRIIDAPSAVEILALSASRLSRLHFADSPLEGTGFEPSVPPRKRGPRREAPRPTFVASRHDLCLMTHPAYRSGAPLRQQPRDLSQERYRWFEFGSLQR